MRKIDNSLALVLITRAEDIPTQWVAHCLNYDIVSQGDSIEHAMRMVREAVILTLQDDIDRGLDPAARKPAPEECWFPILQIMHNPVPLESIPEEDRGQITAAAALLRLPVFEETKQVTMSTNEWQLPELWQLASLEELRDSQRGHPC